MMLGLGDGDIDLTQDVAGNYFSTPTGLIPCSSITMPLGFTGAVNCDSSGGGVNYTTSSGGSTTTVVGSSNVPFYGGTATPATPTPTTMTFQAFWTQYGNYVLAGTAALLLTNMASGSGGRRR
jgi:hypothetical protein